MVICFSISMYLLLLLAIFLLQILNQAAEIPFCSYTRVSFDESIKKQEQEQEQEPQSQQKQEPQSSAKG